MRGVATGAVLVLLAFAVPPARAAKEDFTGSIIFRDGTVSTYTWLSCRHDEIPFARDVSDMEHYEAVVRLQLRAIARIDFDNSAAARKRIASVLPAYQSRSIRRATVTFCDGTVYRDVYLYCEGEWGNAREKGRLSLPAISSLTIGLASGAACPRCGKRFTDAGYRFCPFDGTELSRPVTKAATGQARQSTAKSDGGADRQALAATGSTAEGDHGKRDRPREPRVATATACGGPLADTAKGLPPRQG